MLLSKILDKNIRLLKSIDNNKFTTGIECDSRNIKKGMIFAAIEGKNIKGIDYCEQAIKYGANTVLCKNNDFKKISGSNTNILTSKNIRLAVSSICKKIFSKQPKNIVAVTGTNGKTSITFYLQSIWKKANINSATIGTLGLRYKKKVISTKLTTPDPIFLYRNVDLLRSKNINYLALEASSHGIKQNRIDALKINRGVFCNLSRDHLDYHKNLENYFITKMRLFSEILDKKGIAIVNNSCEYGKKVEQYCKKNHIKVITYGAYDSDWKINNITTYKGYSKVKVIKSKKTFIFKSRLLFKYQIENLVCAMIIAHSYNLTLKSIIKFVEKIKAPPGRLEKLKVKNTNSYVYIDYAHTPLALKKSLIELKNIIKNTGKLKVLFGCGGNRDQGKRILMGRYAAQLANEVYVTDDNPRYENPKKIREQIIKNCKKAITISNRKKAINLAINNLKDCDILLIAGKGHEKYQEVKGKRTYFDDKEIAEEAIKNLDKKCK